MCYRRAAQKLKFLTQALLSLLLISATCAAASLERVANVYRLRGPLSTLPKVERGQTPRAGGACGGVQTQDLVLIFASQKEAEAWMDLDQRSGGPCDISAQPRNSGGFELRLLYKSPDAKSTLQNFVYSTNQFRVIDHWFDTVVATKAKTRPSSKAKKLENTKAEIPTKVESSRLEIFGQNVIDIFQDEESWDKILGTSGKAITFDSPELDRFRVPLKNLDKSLRADIPERQPLAVPLLPLPLLDAMLNFEASPLELKNFEAYDLSHSGDTQPDEKTSKGVLDGLNYLQVLVGRKDWVAARQALEVLEKGNFSKWIPRQNAQWWALKGYIYLKIAETESKRNGPSFRMALDIWREGLQKVAGRGGSSQVHVDFMVLESSRLLFEERLYYAAATVLTWAQRYRWSPSTEERLSYLRAEVHYQLGLFEDAYALFKEYFETRLAVPVNSAEDRRLMPVSAFRMGDAKMRLGKYEEAVRDYTRGLAQAPSAQRVAFEGSWYPSEIRFYPQVFFHRAEASVRLGLEERALGDLRAFVHFALAHPNIGIVFFRIGELLAAIGSDSEKEMGAWRECVFRTEASPGGRLCAAHRARIEMQKQSEEQWPRYLATMEAALARPNDTLFEGVYRENLKVYVAILAADAFIQMKRPFQAWSRLSQLKGIEASASLQSWLTEYRITALAGLMQQRNSEKKYREVIALYESQKRDLLVKHNRHEVLWPVANSFQRLGLWEQAFETFKIAQALKDTVGRVVRRPYDPEESVWNEFWVELNLEMLQKEKVSIKDVNAALGLLPARAPKTLRYKLRFSEITKDSAQERALYRELFSLDTLTWPEIFRYSQNLKNGRLNEDRLRVLNDTVGIWFADPKKAGLSGSPSNALLYELFEARAESRNPQIAIPVIEHLIRNFEAAKDSTLSLEMLLFRQGELLARVGKRAEARQSFERAKALSPTGTWGQLATSALNDLGPM